jgi:flagellar biosynthesis/type III secretory pathway protein FliH
MRYAVLIFLALAASAQDLKSIREEPNPERRSELALDNANNAIDTAEDAYKAGQIEKMQAALTEVADSVDLSYESLSASGKNPRRDKGFKKAEQRTREMLRRLDGFHQMVDFDLRASVEKVRDRVAAVNDNLLNGIMKKK